MKTLGAKVEAGMYFAKRRLKISDEWREAGQPVPEAEGWKTRQILVGAGYLEFRSDEQNSAAAGNNLLIVEVPECGKPSAAAESVIARAPATPGDSQPPGPSTSSKLKPRPPRRKIK